MDGVEEKEDELGGKKNGARRVSFVYSHCLFYSVHHRNCLHSCTPTHLSTLTEAELPFDTS